MIFRELSFFTRRGRRLFGGDQNFFVHAKGWTRKKLATCHHKQMPSTSPRNKRISPLFVSCIFEKLMKHIIDTKMCLSCIFMPFQCITMYVRVTIMGVSKYILYSFQKRHSIFIFIFIACIQGCLPYLFNEFLNRH